MVPIVHAVWLIIAEVPIITRNEFGYSAIEFVHSSILVLELNLL